MKRKVTMQVTIEEHDNGAVKVWIRDAKGELFTRKLKQSISEASVEIGACAFEMAEEADETCHECGDPLGEHHMMRNGHDICEPCWRHIG